MARLPPKLVSGFIEPLQGAASGVLAGLAEGEGRALAAGGFGEDLAGVAFEGLDRDGAAFEVMGGAPELD